MSETLKARPQISGGRSIAASLSLVPSRYWLPSLALLAGLLLLVGCGSSAPAAPASGGAPSGASTAKDLLPLKIGLLPIVDVLPMYVAEQEGFFKEQGVQPDLQLFPSALERDSAFVAGQIDGELNDPVSAGLLNKDGDNARIVRLAYRGNESMAMMVILAAPGSGIKSAADLRGVPIGISKNSIIEYSTDKLLTGAGVAAAEVAKTEVTKIPVRAEMLAKGQIKAATLPEPLATLAQQEGATRVMDDSKTGTGKSVITFRREVVEKNPEAVKRFLAAYEKGVDAINASPDKYRDLMVDKGKVPESLKTTFRVPRFDKAQLPAKADLEDVINWMVGNGLLNKAIPADRMVAEGLLPK